MEVQLHGKVKPSLLPFDQLRMNQFVYIMTLAFILWQLYIITSAMSMIIFQF